MKKILYIPVNTKPEAISTSKTMGREFINRLVSHLHDYELMEIDICNEYIPELNHRILKSRGELVSGRQYEELQQEDKKAVDRINELCNQFLSADIYVLAAPMWSISFPARLKTYIDCVIQNKKVILIDKDDVKGLLDDKVREMVYIQSSGGEYPKLLSWKYNHGVNYLQDIFKFLGIKTFEKIMIEGVDLSRKDRDEALKSATSEMESIISKMELAREPVFIK